MRILRTAALASTVAAGLLLAACATPPSGTPLPITPDPTDETSVATEVHAAWLDDGRVIGLVTYGSSTCLPTVGSVEGEGQRVTVEIDESEEARPCTMDYAPQATLIGVPEGVDAAEAVEIVLTGALSGATSLDGDADLTGTGEEFVPSAGWFSDDGFAVVTWGSSTCAPLVESVEATGDDAITLTFAEFEGNQACTSDLAPRIAIAEVPEGFGDEDDVTLTLTGAGVSGTVEILGDR
ncbi:MAG: hypothetical protein ACK5IN_04135 [Microbacterium sp.]|uniref:hypothetical protein n=1 Tax=Microbacterium sp. TaxID=51671 RepID=UPI003A881334